MKRSQNSFGFTLLNFILVVALMSIISALVSSIFDAFFVQEKYATVTSKRQELYYDVMTMVSDDEAWKKTVDSLTNVSMDCLKNPADFPTIPAAAAGVCDATAGGTFNLYDRNGAIIVDTLTPTAGFQTSGGTCNDFSASGNNYCPLRVELTWRPLCTTCSEKQIEINALVRYVPTPESRRPGFTKNYTLVRNVGKSHEALMVGVGFHHTCALLKGGVQCWGANYEGQLGQPLTLLTSSKPLKVPGLETGVTALSVGYQHNCVIQNNKVKCWGANGTSQSGDTSGATKTVTPFAVEVAPLYLPLDNVTDIYAGVTHSCAVANGAAYCWGGNGNGALGMSEAAGLIHNIDMGEYPVAQPVLDMGSGVQAIAVNLTSSCAVKTDGSVKCWGSNDERGGALDACAGGIRMLGVDPPHGAYKVCGPGIIEGATPPAPITDINGKDIAPNNSYGGWYSTCGLIDIDHRSIRCNPRPIQNSSFPPGGGAVDIVGNYGYCVLTDTGKVKCWGGNEGALGQGTGPMALTGASMNAVQVINLTNVTMIGSLPNGYCAIENGKLYCWGWNDYNRLGFPGASCSGNCPTPTQVGIPGNVTYFAGGALDSGSHSCAVADKRIYCWGKNDVGQLGDGTTTDRITSYVEVTQFQ